MQYLNVWWHSVSHSRQQLAKEWYFLLQFSVSQKIQVRILMRASAVLMFVFLSIAIAREFRQVQSKLMRENHGLALYILLNVEPMLQGFEGWLSSPGLTGIYEEDTAFLVTRVFLTSVFP